MQPQNLSRMLFIALGALVVLGGLALWLVLGYKPAGQANPAGPAAQQNQPAAQQEAPLSPEIALEVLHPQLFADCLPTGILEMYRSCRVDLFRGEGVTGWKVWVTYSGLYDDSVEASRIEASLVNQGGNWTASNVVKTSQCQAGRGHQDFSTELCV